MRSTPESPRNGTEPYMTIREMVSEIRQELREMRAEVVSKEVTEDHEERIRDLEGAQLELHGVWATLVVGASFIAGSAGLVLGVIAAL